MTVYHGWVIRTYASFLGYSAQYTSPIGRSHQTAACFETDAQAVAYAQALVDHLLRCERLGFQGRQQAALAG
jgi:hypothetical protein